MSRNVRFRGIAIGLSLVLGLPQFAGRFTAAAPPLPRAAQGTDETTGAVATASGLPRSAPQKIVAKHLPNPWRLHRRVISGGLPAGEAAFQELVDLGVKTVISVDGAKPDGELARKYGLRYVHLPHGYDGIPGQRARELAKAVRDLPWPIYIHCHHGKHRSPAAAMVACVGAGLLSPSDARDILKLAGTSENYRGLYQSAESAKPLDTALLDALQVEFTEQAEVPPLAEAMIAIDAASERLQAMAAALWRAPAGQPDLDPAHEALLLREHYTELIRMDAAEDQPDGFRELMSASEASARQLEDGLVAWSRAGSPGRPSETVDRALAAVTQSCVACHQAYRDTPQAQK